MAVLRTLTEMRDPRTEPEKLGKITLSNKGGNPNGNLWPEVADRTLQMNQEHDKAVSSMKICG
jgi:hypothetical protein